MGLSIGIRGAGVAGLSLAHEILQAVPGAEISLFDVRERLPHPARTFCFFDSGVSPLPVEADHSWSRVAFSGPEFSRSLRCDTAPYTLIRGDRFFGAMLREVESRGARCVWGCAHVDVQEGGISAGSGTERFDVVVDAAFSPNESRPILWQSFAGMWVEAGEDRFNPNEALLMDLGSSSNESPVSFVYLLPVSARRALIEHTTFSRALQPAPWHLAQCARWAEGAGLTGFSVLETEQGGIPMGLPAPSGGSARAGSGGGALRASTGYAFASIQRQVRAMALEIARGAGRDLAARPMRVFPRWMELGDAVFLRTLARAPEQGSVVMGRFLSRAPERELVSFLSGEAGLWAALKVMACMPKAAMLRTLCWG